MPHIKKNNEDMEKVKKKKEPGDWSIFMTREAYSFLVYKIDVSKGIIMELNKSRHVVDKANDETHISLSQNTRN